MIHNKTDNLETVLTNIAHYNDLLGRVDQLTDRLSADIEQADVDGINHLLQARETLFHEASAKSSQIQQALATLGPANADATYTGSDREERLRLSIDRARLLEKSVLQKQALCEAALADKLRQCRDDLAALTQRKDLMSTYQPPPQTEQARFLDNRQ